MVGQNKAKRSPSSVHMSAYGDDSRSWNFAMSDSLKDQISKTSTPPLNSKRKGPRSKIWHRSGADETLKRTNFLAAAAKSQGNKDPTLALENLHQSRPPTAYGSRLPPLHIPHKTNRTSGAASRARSKITNGLKQKGQNRSDPRESSIVDLSSDCDEEARSISPTVACRPTKQPEQPPPQKQTSKQANKAVHGKPPASPPPREVIDIQDSTEAHYSRVNYNYDDSTLDAPQRRRVHPATKGYNTQKLENFVRRGTRREENFKAKKSFDQKQSGFTFRKVNSCEVSSSDQQDKRPSPPNRQSHKIFDDDDDDLESPRPNICGSMDYTSPPLGQTRKRTKKKTTNDTRIEEALNRVEDRPSPGEWESVEEGSQEREQTRVTGNVINDEPSSLCRQKPITQPNDRLRARSKTKIRKGNKINSVGSSLTTVSVRNEPELEKEDPTEGLLSDTKVSDSSSDRATRLKRKRKECIDDEPIEIDCSSDEDNSGKGDAAFEGWSGSCSFDLIRVTIGTKLARSHCSIRVNADGNEFLLQCRLDKDDGEIGTFLFRSDDLFHLKSYSSDNENESLYLICLGIKATEGNGLRKLRKFYRPTSGDLPRDLSKAFVNLQFRNEYDIETFMESASEMYPILDGKLHETELEKYAPMILTEIKGEERRKRRKKSVTNDLLLVFPLPYEYDESRLVAACKDMNEPKDCTESDTLEVGVTQETKGVVETTTKKHRIHYLTIREDDKARYEDGEFLNDTLIDFWMQWMLRNEDREDCPVQIFTTHFFSTLRDEGLSAVASWTAKKNIDVFAKKFVFLPVNKTLHWSLCVIVNPGKIKESWEVQELLTQQGKLPPKFREMEAPCILFLDSLRAHSKQKIAHRCRDWLNKEWKRLKKDESDKEPFTKRSIPLLSPDVPTQQNGWDCGVFVCRYAYALFKMRCRPLITFSDTTAGGHGVPKITNSDEFAFGMNEISRLRVEMDRLVSNLSLYYKELKGRADTKARHAKATKKRAVPEAFAVSEKMTKDRDTEDQISGTAGDQNDGLSSRNLRADGVEIKEEI